MLRYKSLDILRSFSDEDNKKFGLFLKSPYFNTSEKLCSFFNCLLKYYPGYSEPELTNEYLKNELDTKSDSTVRNLFADLLPICERYIAVNRFENSNEVDLKLIQGMLDRGLKDEVNVKIEEFEANMKKRKEFYTGDLLTTFNILNQKYETNFFNINFKNDEMFHKMIDILYDINESLFYYFFINCLNAYVVTVTHSTQLSIPPPETHLGRFLNEFFPDDKINKLLHGGIAGKNCFYKDILELHWLYLQILMQRDLEKNFRRYNKILNKVQPRLHIDERYNFYDICTQFFPYVLEHPELEETEFEFYTSFLENEGFKHTGHNYMTLRQFKYFYTRGDTTRRYEWTDKLFKDHIGSLEPQYRESITAMRNAYLFFKRDKNLRAALEELNKVHDHGEHTIKRDIKYLSIMIFFEMKDYRMAKNFLERLIKFLNRKDIPRSEKLAFKDFIKYTSILIKHKLKERSLDAGELKNEIEKKGFFPSKPWVIEKLNEMM